MSPSSFAPGSSEVCRFPSQRGCCGCGDHDRKVSLSPVWDIFVSTVTIHTICFTESKYLWVDDFRLDKRSNLERSPRIMSEWWAFSWISVVYVCVAGGWCWTLTLGILFLYTQMAMKSFPMSSTLQVSHHLFTLPSHIHRHTQQLIQHDS